MLRLRRILLYGVFTPAISLTIAIAWILATFVYCRIEIVKNGFSAHSAIAVEISIHFVEENRNDPNNRNRTSLTKHRCERGLSSSQADERNISDRLINVNSGLLVVE